MSKRSRCKCQATCDVCRFEELIFAVVGMNLFGKVAYYDANDEHVNFRTFDRAMMSLLRFSTGDATDLSVHGVPVTPGRPKFEDLLAAAAIFDVRVVVVSAACETPLVYDVGNEDDEAVVVLGHGGGQGKGFQAPSHTGPLGPQCAP